MANFDVVPQGDGKLHHARASLNALYAELRGWDKLSAAQQRDLNKRILECLLTLAGVQHGIPVHRD